MNAPVKATMIAINEISNIFFLNTNPKAIKGINKNPKTKNIPCLTAKYLGL